MFYIKNFCNLRHSTFFHLICYLVIMLDTDSLNILQKNPHIGTTVQINLCISQIFSIKRLWVVASAYKIEGRSCCPSLRPSSSPCVLTAPAFWDLFKWRSVSFRWKCLGISTIETPVEMEISVGFSLTDLWQQTSLALLQHRGLFFFHFLTFLFLLCIAVQSRYST